jgi:hypothetical protein
MLNSKQQLRSGAFTVLKNLGYAPEVISAQGVVPGARLMATNGPAAGRPIAVRTSQDREVGLLRRLDNRGWRTIPNVYEVVVAVPSLSEPEWSVEVFCFDPKTLIARFDAALRQAGARELSLKAPIFIALDKNPGKGALAADLGSDAKWRQEISTKSITQSYQDGFIDGIKKQIAKRIGVDASKVIVDIRITA